MRVKINLNLNYKLREADKAQFNFDGKLKDEEINREVSDFLIRQAIQIRFPKMDTDKAKRFAKIQNALIDSEDTLEVDGTLFDFIVDAVDKADLSSAVSSWKITMLDHLEELKKQPTGPKLEAVKES